LVVLDKVDEEPAAATLAATLAAHDAHDEELAAAATLSNHDEEFAAAATLANHDEELATAPPKNTCAVSKKITMKVIKDKFDKV
jgi:hypothetical protein